MLGTSRPLAAHTFAACSYVCPEVIWAALTAPDQTAAFLHGLAAHSTWVPGAPIAFRYGNGVALTGRVLHARRNERLSYLLQSGPDDPPVYLTWLLRPTPGGCTIRLEIDEPDGAGAAEDAEDVWLPVLAALQDLVNPGWPARRGDPAPG